MGKLEDEILKTVNFPMRKPGGGVARIEVMADSMRVGKTTAVGVIAAGLRTRGFTVTESYEDWQHNPYLKGSYSDPGKNFLESQKWFIKRKWEQVKETSKGILIQDVAPEMDYCYALTNMILSRMSREHFAQYETFYNQLAWGEVTTPTCLVYLKVSDRELLRRANASRREFESVDSDYFLIMKKVNRAWLARAKENGGYKILEVETDHLNFADDAMAREELVNRAHGEIESV